MTIRGRHRLVAGVAGVGAVVAAVGSACGGPRAEHASSRVRPSTSLSRSSSPRARPAHSSPTTAVPVASPAGWPYDGVAPPRVVDRGDDVVASMRSLLAYGGWLAAHHPDPSLIRTAYAPDSQPFSNLAHEIAALRRRRERIVEVDAAPLDVEIITRDANVVSVRLTEHLAHRDLVDATGRLVDRQTAATEHYRASMVRAYAGAPWRVNLVDSVGPRIEVQL